MGLKLTCRKEKKGLLAYGREYEVIQVVAGRVYVKGERGQVVEFGSTLEYIEHFTSKERVGGLLYDIWSNSI